MEVTQKSRNQFRYQNIAFVSLFLTAMIMLATLTNKYKVEMDWTATGRNTLSAATIELLKRIPGQVLITSYATDSELIPIRKKAGEMLDRYRKHKTDIEYVFIDPNTEPDLVRALGIQVDGELVIEYQGRREHVQHLTEENITNALHRLLRGGERKLIFLTGHGERQANGRANHDYGTFFNKLAGRGLQTISQALIEKPQVPADAAALVVASPQVKLLDGEVKLIRDYVKQGGNLLWIIDPGEPHGLDKLADDLGIEILPGLVIDRTTELLGISDPSFAIVAEYPAHPIIGNLTYLTIYPRACGLQKKGGDPARSEWDIARFLNSAPNSWVETGPLKGGLTFDKGDIKGPVSIGLALSREVKRGKDEKPIEQRIVVLCDGDFLSNTYLGNHGNQKMGENIINWVNHDDSFIDIPSRIAADKEINLSQGLAITIALLFLILLPLALLISGVMIWMKRRKQ
ncbi:MAG: GldG family protein [Gammaproteobacteria bacterium]|nr:GldG family protein [Gammaproteobacteria bacterium]MDH5653304.1 GldG family protein [Gammaproteobacteria bacterium]